MKSVLTKLSVLLIAAVALSACSKKGGNSAPAAGVGVGIACVQGVNGMCSNLPPYYGPDGRWSGNLAVQNPALFNQMLMENGAGQIYGGIGQFGIAIRLSSQSQSAFSISSRTYGGWNKLLQKNGQAYAQSVNAFSIIAQNMYFGGGYAGQYQNPNIVAPQVNTGIQISSTYVDPSRMAINTVVIYRGTQVASGILQMMPGGGGYGGGYARTSSYAPPILPATPRYY